MQPWTLASPAMMGQFPAASLLYRQGLVATGDTVATIKLNVKELENLRGTPLPQDASFDELRLQDVQTDGKPNNQSQRIDPLVHYVGRSRVLFSDEPPTVSLKSMDRYVDRKAQTVQSVTGELKLDYGNGALVIDAPRAQGVGGNLATIGEVRLSDMIVQSPLDLIHIIAVPLDGEPLAKSGRILLQVMSEERTSGFATEGIADGRLKITEIGKNPWQVRPCVGTVKFTRSDAASLKVRRLDHSGRIDSEHGTADSIVLNSTTLYYLISAD
jgi:hypothetical protein